MPTLREHAKDATFRCIGIGNSGTGKTGSLVELINNMDELGIKRVVIADFDKGVDILAEKVKPELMDRVFIEEFRDDLQISLQVGAQLPATAELQSSWARTVMTFSNWPGVGKINDLGPDSIFVVDSLTGLGDTDFQYALTFGKDKGDPWRSTGTAMLLQDKFVQLCVALKCHFILFSHVRFMGGGGKKEMEDKKGSKYIVEVDSDIMGTAYPSALGRNLPTTLARHFNTMIEYKLEPSGRVVRTVPDFQGRMALKVPFSVPNEMPQATGLYQIFKAFLATRNK